jgi:hypothetical protein
VGEALDAIDAARTTLAKLDLTGLTASELLELAARCEKATRHDDVIRHDLSHELHQREVGEIGGAPHKVLADWLRITPTESRRRAQVTEPLAARTALTGEPLAPHQPGTAAAWRDRSASQYQLRLPPMLRPDLPRTNRTMPTMSKIQPPQIHIVSTLSGIPVSLGNSR